VEEVENESDIFLFDLSLDIELHSKDNEAARRRLRRRILHA
jgi:hypothetical protein